MYEVLQTPEFTEWLDSLDTTVVGRVANVLNRIAAGNWGDYKPVAGAPSIFERRLLGRGPGFRLYFCRQGTTVIVLLIGGDKSTQERTDIRRAVLLRERYV